MMLRHKRAAISPVIAVILLLAAAVMLSAIAFGWSLAFLGNIGNAVGGQQPLQNQATQAGIVIEQTRQQAYQSGVQDGYIAFYVRNIGTYSPLQIGSVEVVGAPANAGLRNSVFGTQSGGSWTVSLSGAQVCSRSTDAVDCGTGSAVTSLAKASSAEVFIRWPKDNVFTVPGNAVQTGDTVTVQVATTVGASNIVTVTIP